jgi:phosphoenolpyruvate carboxylase
VSVIRAFTYFSHLANLAEDRHHIRRRAVHERAGHVQEGSLAHTWQRMAGRHRRRRHRQTLAQAHLSPVLTAHPTEVQRKSILDAERDIARLLAERDTLVQALLPARPAGANWPPTKRKCAPASPSCGRPGCCASPSSPWPTKSKTR